MVDITDPLPEYILKRDVSDEKRDGHGQWVCGFCGMDKDDAKKENEAGKTCPAHADQPHGSGSKIPGRQWSPDPGEDPDGPKAVAERIRRTPGKLSDPATRRAAIDRAAVKRQQSK